MRAIFTVRMEQRKVFTNSRMKTTLLLHRMVRTGRGGNIVSEIQLSPSAEWESFGGKLTVETGKNSLYFTYEGDGYVDFKSFRLV